MRPIALSECLLKCVESAVFIFARTDLVKYLEPHQLGAGTSDGVVVIAKV